MPLDDTTPFLPAPRSAARETAALAWHTAATAKRTATADATKATKAAIVAGVLFDHTRYPQDPGTEMVVYRGAEVSINLKVGQPGTALDVESFLEELAKYLSKPQIARMVAKHRSATAAPHSFSSSLV